MQFLNNAACKFVALAQLTSLQATLARALAMRGFKGLMLLAEEGFNFFLAAGSAAIHDFLAWLRLDGHFQNLDLKERWSAAPPSGKPPVKIKLDIIRMNHPPIRPLPGRAPAIDAAMIKRWLF